MLDNADEIYAILHKSGPNEKQQEDLKELFPDKISDTRINLQNHIVDSMYYEFLRPVFTNSISDLSMLENKLVNCFPDLILKVNRIIWKHLNIQFNKNPKDFNAAKQLVNKRIEPYKKSINGHKEKLKPWHEFKAKDFNKEGIMELYEKLEL